MLMLILIEVYIIKSLSLGIALKALGRIEEAIKDYSKAIEINPQDDDAFNNRGLDYWIII